MDFVNYLKNNQPVINQVLEKLLKDFQKEHGKNSQIKPLLAEFIKSSEDGKRVRAILIVLGYELFGGKKTSEIFKIAAALEIFQTAILSHDDIIDRSETRRGKPSLYKALGGDQKGASRAIVLSDLGFFLFYKTITDSKFSPDKKNKALEIVSKLTINTGIGELLDIELPQKKAIEEKDILEVYNHKTAWYTFIGPLQLGATLAGAEKKDLKELLGFGYCLGLAFQIQDDILGIFGTENNIGKPVTSDIEEGKITLLFLYVLEKGTREQRMLLSQYYGKGKIDKKELASVKAVFKDSGALGYAQAEAVKYTGKAEKLIPKISSVGSWQFTLKSLTEYLLNRNR